jgi:putative SOS response-associated peptidase YedK
MDSAFAFQALEADLPPMCNAYTVRPRLGASALAAVVSSEVSRLPTPLVRRTGQGVAVVMEEGNLVPRTMRWGIHTPRFDSINNARSDKLASPTWAESVEQRRCLVPISTFYEWQEKPHAGKQPYEFRRGDGDWIWVAGLYKRSEKYGDCYATITTEPPAWVLPIHDRLLAILDFEDGMAFLRGEMRPSAPYQGDLVAVPCVSPLKRRPPVGGDPQGELF